MGYGGSIAEAIARMGNAQAEGALRSGAIWSNVAQNVGQIPGQIYEMQRGIARDRRDESRNAMMDKKFGQESELAGIEIEQKKRDEQTSQEVIAMAARGAGDDEILNFLRVHNPKAAQAAQVNSLGFQRERAKAIAEGTSLGTTAQREAAAALDAQKVSTQQGFTASQSEKLWAHQSAEGTKRDAARLKAAGVSASRQDAQSKGQFVGQTSDGKAVIFDPVTKTFSVQELPGGGNLSGRTNTPLSDKTQQTLTGGISSLNLLNQLEQLIPDTHSDTPGLNVVGGKLKQLGVKAGMSGPAQQFEDVVQTLKVEAQAIIKGIPSNFDVQTFIAALPQLNQSKTQALNKAKIAKTKLSTELKNQLAYYKGSNRMIPQEIVDAARNLGVDVDSIQGSANPWGGGTTTPKRRVGDTAAPKILSIQRVE